MGPGVIHRGDAENAEFPQRELTDRIIAAAIEVHSHLGPGMLESVYQRALERELRMREVPFETQCLVPVYYKGERLETALRLDLWVDRRVVVEVKCIAGIEEIHRAQLLTYLRQVGCEVGLLINFNVVVLKRGIKRVVNSLRSSAFSAALR